MLERNEKNRNKRRVERQKKGGKERRKEARMSHTNKKSERLKRPWGGIKK